MTDILDLKDTNAELVARSELATRVQLLDAIDRELASRSPGYADNALRLADAYARVSGALGLTPSRY